MGTSLLNFLFILENELQQFQTQFSRFSTAEVCKVHSALCVCNGNPMVGRNKQIF
jgi:hypothetical protein